MSAVDLSSSTLDIIIIVVPLILTASINLSKFNQLVFLILPVVVPNSSPIFTRDNNSLSSNKVSGKNGSIPERVSYIFVAP